MIHIFKTAVYPGAGAAKFAVMFFPIVSVFWAVSPLPANVAQDTKGVNMSEKLEQEAADLAVQKRFLEASAKYGEAASKVPEDTAQAQEKAAKYRAQSRYWFGFHFMMDTSHPKFFRVDDIEKAVSAFDEAEHLYEGVAHQVGMLTARGSKYYMQGEEASLKEDFGGAVEVYKKSGETFFEVLQKPGLPPDFRADLETWRRLAERGSLFAEIMALVQQSEARGEVKARVSDLRRLAPEEDWPFYDSEFHLAGVFARFQAGAKRAELWDPNAANDFEYMRVSLDMLQSTVGKIQEPGLQSQMKHLQQGWRLVCEGETHHAGALRYLFEKGDTLQAKELLKQAAKSYMNAEDAFAQAACERKGIAAVMERGKTIYERSRILTEVTTTHSMWMGMGRWFVLFFLIALAGLASSKWFLGINFSPSMIISASLFVGLVGGFTRYAHQFLSYIPKK